jgi:hypothetical protein
MLCAGQLKERFLRNQDVQDVRQIDMLVIKARGLPNADHAQGPTAYTCVCVCLFLSLCSSLLGQAGAGGDPQSVETDHPRHALL